MLIVFNLTLLGNRDIAFEFSFKCDLCIREVLEAEKKGSTVEMKLAKITNEVTSSHFIPTR